MFKDDMPGHLHELQNEVDHWKTTWEMVNVAEKPDTLDDSRNKLRPIPHVVIILMVMSVLTAASDRHYSAMLRLKNYLRSTMTTERM